MKTKEEIFNEIPFLDIKGDYFNIPRTKVLEAMEEYAKCYHESKVNKLNKADVIGSKPKGKRIIEKRNIFMEWYDVIKRI